MEKLPKTVIMSLGGSIIVPDKIQADFLKKFKKFVLKFLKKGVRFIIVAGGGAPAREYIKAASTITRISDEDKDWLGIHATRLNAHLLRTIFKNQAYPVVLDNPLKQIKHKGFKLFIGSGWRPGWSTDYDAVLLAERFGADKIVNASNIDYVYEKDPSTRLGASAKPIKDITWDKYRKLIAADWKPGMRAPVDPVAARLASKLKMTVFLLNGTNIKNLEKAVMNQKFKGTIIHP